MEYQLSFAHEESAHGLIECSLLLVFVILSATRARTQIGNNVLTIWRKGTSVVASTAATLL